MGAIAEETNAWSYSLPDGANTPRQLSDASGEITLAARYTPWGDTMESYGDGGFTFGYFGGVMDAATGLLYVGNGQYHDPYTGRFLTRDARPENSNPYIPFDPISALFAPLGLLSLYYSRKKQPDKMGMWLVLLIVIGSVGMGLSACGDGEVTLIVDPDPASSTETVTVVPTSTETPGPGTQYTLPAGATATAIATLTGTDCLSTRKVTPINNSSELINALALYAINEPNVKDSIPSLIDTADRINLMIYAVNEYSGLWLEEVAYILASAHWESHWGWEKMMWEDLSENPDGYEDNTQLGNIYPGDGRAFRGRGFVHVTGRNAYTELEEHFSRNLTSGRGPELLATDLQLSAQATVYGMVNGIFSTWKLSDYRSKDGCEYDFTNARAIINGNDNDTKIALIAKGYWEILRKYV